MELLGHALGDSLPLPRTAADGDNLEQPPDNTWGCNRHRVLRCSLRGTVFHHSLSRWVIKSSKDHLGSGGVREKKLFQRCEENVLSVKDILCTAPGSTQGVLFTAPASRTYYTAGSGATIRVQLIT